MITESERNGNTEMAGTVVVKKTADLLQEIYRNVKMASDSIVNIMPKVKDEKFKSDLTVQISVYEAFASRCAKLLAEENAKPVEESAVTKMTTKWGIKMNVAKDSTTEHLVQMMIEGTTMGVGEMLRWIRESENTNVSEAALRLARDVCSYEEKTVEEMKALLR